VRIVTHLKARSTAKQWRCTFDRIRIHRLPSQSWVDSEHTSAQRTRTHKGSAQAVTPEIKRKTRTKDLAKHTRTSGRFPKLVHTGAKLKWTQRTVTAEANAHSTSKDRHAGDQTKRTRRRPAGRDTHQTLGDAQDQPKHILWG
jgi:hypothetical protein